MFRKSFIFAMLAALVCGLCVSSFAWDETGHKITAYIAWQRMTPDVRERVVRTLMAAPEDAQISSYFVSYASQSVDARKREFFILISSWPDLIKERTLAVRYSKYNHSDWHYTDIFWTDKDGKVTLLPDMDANGFAMQKLVDFDKTIRSSAPDSEKAIAIAWLEHLVGDVHQPLHVSSRVTDANPKGDQGGNLFYLTPRGTPRDQQDNLHSFWDSIVVRYMPNLKDLCDASYMEPIADDIMKLYPYDKVKARLQPGKFDVWKDESFQIATTQVYSGVALNQAPPDAYKKKAFETAEERLALGGYRLGDLFNEVFAAPAPTPTPSPTPTPTPTGN